MHQKDHSLLERMQLQTQAVVVNQCDRNHVERFTYRGNPILWIDTTDRGLSKSRNKAIAHATADICMLADDDLVYREGYGEKIISAFQAHEDMALIGFEVQGIEQKFKDYPKEAHPVGYLQSMKMASVEIAFRRKEIAAKNLQFNELIGAGTKYLMGEENAFLFHCLKAGLHIYFLPIVISDLHIGDSTWFSKRDEAYFVAKGASLAAMESGVTTLLILQWCLRKYPLYKNEMKRSQALSLMIKGKREYKKASLKRAQDNA